VRLLLDGSFSPLLVRRLADVYPESMHIKTGKHPTSDRALVQLAGLMDFVIVTMARDFDDLAITEPDGWRVLRLDTGPLSTDEAERLLRELLPTLEATPPDTRVLEVRATRA
jgi:predicted nuclease of predicted toxin-antitoxin system